MHLFTGHDYPATNSKRKASQNREYIFTTSCLIYNSIKTNFHQHACCEQARPLLSQRDVPLDRHFSIPWFL